MKRKAKFLNGKWGLVIFLGAVIWFSSVMPGWAAGRTYLDERGFEFYTPGEIHMQQGWNKAFRGEVVVAQEAETGNRFVMFKKGNSRMVKRIPVTTSNKIVITFDFLPGSRNIGGRLYFDQVGVGGLALRFAEGNLHIWEAPPYDTNTGIEFKVNDWNRFKLKLDFQTHEYEVFMNEESVGIFKITSSAVTGINQLNLFGGGRIAISRLDNLSIVSADD